MTSEVHSVLSSVFSGSPWFKTQNAVRLPVDRGAGFVVARVGPAWQTSRVGLRAAMTAKFERVFSELRAMLTRHVGSLCVTEDSPGRYCLEGGRHPKHGTPMPIAWVQVGKAYVSFHHMGVYARPDLLKGISKELRARMQGKSCFHFTTVDKVLFAELEELTVRSFDAFRNAPFMK